MKTFKLAKVTPLGDYDETYGQRYWCETNEQLEPVMFNTQERNLQSGATITAEEVLLKESKKGTPYHQLKKVKILDGPAPAQASIPTALTTEMPQSVDSTDRLLKRLLELVEENNEMLRKLTGDSEY